MFWSRRLPAAICRHVKVFYFTCNRLLSLTCVQHAKPFANIFCNISANIRINLCQKLQSLLMRDRSSVIGRQYIRWCHVLFATLGTQRARSKNSLLRIRWPQCWLLDNLKRVYCDLSAIWILPNNRRRKTAAPSPSEKMQCVDEWVE